MEIVRMKRARRPQAIFSRGARFGRGPRLRIGRRRPLSQPPKAQSSMPDLPAKAEDVRPLGDTYRAIISRIQDARRARGESEATSSQRAARYRGNRDADGFGLIVSIDGDILYCTAGAAKLLARDEESLVGSALRCLIPELPLRRGTPGYNLAFAELNFSGNDRWLQYSIPGPGADHLSIEVSVKSLKIGALGVLLVRLRSPVEASALNDDLARLIAIEDGRDEGVVVLNAEGRIVHINSAYEAMTGLSLHDFVDSAPRVLGAHFQKPRHHPDFWSILRTGGEAHYTCVSRKKNGEWHFVEQSFRPFVDSLGNITHFIGRQRDLGRNDDALEQLLQLAYFDALTGLPNRNLFVDRLHQEIARAGRDQGGFTLLVLDVDGFKAVNDTYGHAAGDLLLQELSVRLKRCVRDADTVARLSGDEFAIILTSLIDPNHVTEVLTKIRRIVSGDFSVDGNRLPVSVSIGAAIFPEHGENGDYLMKAADWAMYDAKRSKSRGWSFFDMAAPPALLPGGEPQPLGPGFGALA